MFELKYIIHHIKYYVARTYDIYLQFNDFRYDLIFTKEDYQLFVVAWNCISNKIKTQSLKPKAHFKILFTSFHI